MSGILVIERSSTLTHVLARTFRVANIPQWDVLNNFEDGLAHLRSASDKKLSYHTVIVGVPPRLSPDFMAFLRFLNQLDISLLMLAHERHLELREFCAERSNMRFLLWTEFAKIPTVLKQLVKAGSLTAAPAASTPATEFSKLPTPNKVEKLVSGSTSQPHIENAAVDAVIKVPTADSSIELQALAPANGIRVLFVDDSASIRKAYGRLLERSGYSTDLAASISQAEALVAFNRYDLIVVDYFLPDGNGDTLCRNLRKMPNAEHSMLAIITGAYRDEIIRRCLDAGAMECMFKNEAKELFLARINSMTRQIQMQKRIEEEKVWLNGILGSVGDGVYGVDGKGIITFVNPKAMSLLGYNSDTQMVGHSAHALFHGRDELGTTIDASESPLSQVYAKGDQRLSTELVFWRKRGDAMPVDCSVVPLLINAKREGSVVVFRNISERKSAEKLSWELSHDLLTGLFNARHLNQTLAKETQKCRRKGGHSALLFIDIDRYAHIVDVSGVAAAERLIIEFGARLSKQLRDRDELARIDGDRFALLLSGVQLENLFSIADGFRELMRSCHYRLGDVQRHATASIGVAIISKDTPSAEYAMEHARLACQTAKTKGRNQTQIFVGEHEVSVARELEAGWSDRFREAIAKDQFLFMVQPIVPMAALPPSESAISQHLEWRLDGMQGDFQYLFEILIRLVGNEGEIISPSVFVPLAERVGMMPKIDLWVITRAARQLKALKHLGSRLSFTVNLSNQTLSDPETLGLIEATISAAQLLPGQLVFEVTETSEMANLQTVKNFMLTMKAMGCRFALDDFGTGFSSFTHLRHLPVDFVKIEGSFVEGMISSELDEKMVRSITSLAQSLNFKVIAEHVDNFATLNALRSCNVDMVQGYFLGKPKPLSEIDFSQALLSQVDSTARLSEA